MELVFLGTSSMVPTKDRNVQSVYLEYDGEGILFDCGEGTQRQMNIAGINRNKVKKIFVSHWHGDHVSGIVGLIQTLGGSNNPKSLVIFGPKGTKKHVDCLLGSCVFDLRVDLKVKEILSEELSVVDETDSYLVSAIPMVHGVPCVAYSFVEKDKRKMISSKLKKFGVSGSDVGVLQKGGSVRVDGVLVSCDDVSKVVKGRKVCFVFDTLPNDNIYLIAKDSDLLVGESTYSFSLKSKAFEYMHMTSLEMAKIALSCGVKQLVLTHFSQRYKSVDELEVEAKSVFSNVLMAYDFLKIKL